MSADIIHLLSDHLANQIAAGEVIQRPASAVKELLENAIDAGATDIRLTVKDAGKELLQVHDNGKGMTPTDARMSFERHATSKISSIEDLFQIRTMGFRGEALASIAAVAQVELKTKTADAEMGSQIMIEGSQVRAQQPCAMNPGTIISVRNLFYNVPARRQFLKSNTTEYRHILDEFTRVALAYPAIAFRLEHNGEEQYRMPAGTLKARIVQLLGNNVEKHLVPVEEKLDIIKITGFIGKPSAASKSRGNQFFFMNQRFIRSAYLHHAVMQGYHGLIDKEHQPLYVLQMDVDPTRVDVNVHPSKQEVKFEDDRLIYAMLQSTIKHTLARYNIAPSLDFSLNPEITKLPSLNNPKHSTDELHNNYLSHTFSGGNQAHLIEKNNALHQWKSLYKIAEEQQPQDPLDRVVEDTSTSGTLPIMPIPSATQSLLIHGTYLATTLKSGLALLHVQRALERIHYERLLLRMQSASAVGQKLLFPIHYEVSVQDHLLLQDALPELQALGFDISSFGQNSFVVHALPVDIAQVDDSTLLDDILEQLRHLPKDKIHLRKEILLQRMAKRMAVQPLPLKQPEEQQALIDELLAGASPEFSPDGKRIVHLLTHQDLSTLFTS